MPDGIGKGSETDKGCDGEPVGDEFAVGWEDWSPGNDGDDPCEFVVNTAPCEAADPPVSVPQGAPSNAPTNPESGADNPLCPFEPGAFEAFSFCC